MSPPLLTADMSAYYEDASLHASQLVFSYLEHVINR